MPKLSQPLSVTLPPLIFGTATLNYQFNPDPYALHPHELIATALRSGLRAFDTSPYYGPAEGLLGDALQSYLQSQSTTSPPRSAVSTPNPPQLTRSDLFLLTKCGRLAGNTFDYSPSYIRFSIARSLRRLHTSYLDVVYLHDCEFVTPAQVLTGILALRAIRDTDASIRYIGLSGYPVHLLSELAELVHERTGEPVDIVQSYAHFTVVNQALAACVPRFKAAGVGVVTNASPLGMGLLRGQGVPKGLTGGRWHPAPDGLREACAEIARWLEREGGGVSLESVAGRWALEEWARLGAEVGTSGAAPINMDVNGNTNTTTADENADTTSSENTDRNLITATNDAHTRENENSLDASTSASSDATATASTTTPPPRKPGLLGVSVIGISTPSELADTLRVYSSILDGLSEFRSSTSSTNTNTSTVPTATDSDTERKHESLLLREKSRVVVQRIRDDVLRPEWRDYSWESPEVGFVNGRGEWGVNEDDLRAEREEVESRQQKESRK